MNCIVLPLLMLGLSLASILCWAAEPNTDQAKAIAEIEKLGGRVAVDEKSPGKPVISVGLSFTETTDAGLVNLKGFTRLQELYLWDTKITDAGLENIKGLTQLQKLVLANTEVTDAGMVNLKGLTKLQWLQLAKTKVTDAGMVNLKGFRRRHGPNGRNLRDGHGGLHGAGIEVWQPHDRSTGQGRGLRFGTRIRREIQGPPRLACMP